MLIFDYIQSVIMVYIVAGIIILLCILVIIYAYRVYKENKQMGPKKGQRFDDDDELSIWR